MTPEDLRASIPALGDVTYFNTGASGPSPRSVTEAAAGFLRYHKEEAFAAGGAYEAATDAYESSREAIAGHVGADPEEIALVESTSDGISALAAAIDWRTDDVVVRTDLEHPAGVLPWERVARLRGASVRVVETDAGTVDVDAFTDAVADARLVCFSSLSWNYGTRLPVRELSEIARDAGARVLVDAVQSPGQMPVDVREWGADYVAGSGHKWLLGPWGAGFLYVRSGVADELHPAQVCSRGVEDTAETPYELEAGARRFECGTASPAPHVGLAEAIDVVEGVGLDAVQRRIERLTDRLKAGLDDVEGARLLSPIEYESGLVTVAVDDPEATVERLDDAGIKVRTLPQPHAVRASVHAFNTEREVDRLLDALQSETSADGV